MAISLEKSQSYGYSDHYKSDLFVVWYNAGRPASHSFHKTLISMNKVDPTNGKIPSMKVLFNWIKEDWTPVADDLDTQVAEDLEKRMIADKVEMLTRHANIARDMQEKSLEFIKDHELNNIRTAIDLLTKAIDIERNSVGTPVIAAKLGDMSDEELFQELKFLVSGSKISEISPNDDETTDS